MHIWTLTNWEEYYNLEEESHRTGLRLKFDKDVDPEVRRAIKEFCKWLRREYFFPIRVPIYVKTLYKIKAMDGELVYGTFFGPFDRNVEPYIRISTGDYYDTVQKNGKDNALGCYLVTIAHELTHYFQWINDIKLTRIGYERQATAYSGYIIDEYKETREHP
ncbi:hypothetical protein ACWFRC_05890 [Bacillus cereus]